MIVINVPVANCTPQTIVIGRRGTYETMQIAFDLSFLIENYGSGTAVLAIKRSQDESAYPAVVTQEDTTLLWTVNETDTAYVGSGECQLMWYVDGGLAKTIIYPMVVMRDILSTTEEPPDGYENWIESLTALGAETQQNAQNAAQSASDAENAKDDAVAAKEAAEAALEEFTTPTASATTLPAGSQATATYSDGNFVFGIPRGANGSPGDPGVTPNFSIGTVTTLEPTQPATATITGTAEAPVLNLGIPKGDPGTNGVSPAVTITEITDGHRVTITDSDHPQGQTFDVMDGASDAGNVSYDESATYQAGSVGAELQEQTRHLSDLEDTVSTTQIINSASGAIASFSDGADSMPVRKLVANIEPVQDLHGYDNPWPAGGGKNKFDPYGEDIGKWCDSSGNIIDNSTSYISPPSAISESQLTHSWASNTGLYSLIYIYYDSNGGFLKRDIFYAKQSGFVETLPTGTATVRLGVSLESGTITTDIVASFKIQVEAGSTSTEWTPYENICPISGHTGAEIYDDPAYGGLINWNQLLKELSLADPINWVVNGGTGTVADDVCNVTLTAPIANLGSRIDSKTYYDSIAGHKYYITFGIKTPKAITGLRIYYDAHSAVSEAITTTNSWVRVSKIVTPQAGYANAYVQVFFGNNATDGFAVGDVISVKNLMLCDLTAMFGAGNEPTTTAEFEALFSKDYYAYNAGEETTVSAVNGDEYNQISVTFPSEAGTVYGGTLDVTTGLLTVNRGFKVYDGSEDERINGYSGKRFVLGCDDYSSPATSVIDNIITNRLKTVAKSSQGEKVGLISGSDPTRQEFMINIGVSTVPEVRSWLAENPLQVSYPLKSTVTYQLTPQEVKTLLGTNNIWSSTGDTTVEYTADTKLYIDNKITRAIANALNS